MLDLAGIPLRSRDRTLADPLVIAGGPCAQNPEPLAPFVDVFVLGRRGTESAAGLRPVAGFEGVAWRGQSGQGRGGRSEPPCCWKWPARCRSATCPRFYEPEYREGRFVALHRLHPDAARHDRAGGASRFRRHTAAHPAHSYRTSSACTTGSPSRSCAAVPGSAASARARRSSGRCACARWTRSCKRRWKATDHTGFNEISLLSLVLQRLSAFRRTDPPAQGSLRTAGCEHLGAQPARERATPHDRRV